MSPKGICAFCKKEVQAYEVVRYSDLAAFCSWECYMSWGDMEKERKKEFERSSQNYGSSVTVDPKFLK